MDKTEAVEIIKQFQQKIEAMGIKPIKIILHGSYATDSYGKESDIDIVVVSNDFVDKSYWERIDILADVIYDIFEPIEAIAVTEKEWEQNDDSLIIQSARKGGEVLFAA